MEQSVHSPAPQFRDYEKLYRLLIEDLQEYAIFMMEPDGTIISWNAGVERILGYAEPQFVGRHVSMLFVPEDVRAGAPDMELSQARKHGRAPDERWHLRKDGRRIRVDGVVTAILDGSNLVGFSKIMRDATRRWVAENELRQSAERFRGVFANASIGLAIIDLHLRFLEVNRTLCEITGYSRDELMARDIRAVIHPADAPEELALINRLLSGEIPSFVMEQRYVHKRGHDVWVRNSVSLMHHREGKPGQIVLLIEDITDRKQAHDRLRQSQKLESIGVLAGGVAHDFNNLLTGVIGNASLALQDLSPFHPAHGLLTEVIHSARKAADLTRQLLAYAGKGRFMLKSLNLSESVFGIVPLIQTSIPEKVSLELSLADNLPLMEADPSQVQQIIMNLVINAAEAIENVEGAIRVSTGVHRLAPEEVRNMDIGELNPGTHVYVRVSDTGPGMDEDTRSRIFDPFFTTKFTGRGLGLAAVSGIIRGHRGAIRVDSTPGKGSMFTVLFPALPSEASAEDPRPVERAPSLSELSGTGTILVADDEKIVIEVSKTALGRYGYTVLLADDGEQALQIFRRRAQEIALVLLDIGMPKLSGEEVFQQMKTIRPEVPIIITSGYNDVFAAERFKGAERNMFLQKPYTADELAAKIKSVLSP